jgi:hypothetical protein
MPAYCNINSIFVTWPVFSGATSYAFGMWENNRDGPVVGWGNIGNVTSYVATPLKSCQQYYYEVWAVGPVPAVLIESGYVITVKPATNLQSIVNGWNVQLLWAHPCGCNWAFQYLDIGTSPGAHDILQQPLDQGIAWYIIPSVLVLEAGRTYYWRINICAGSYPTCTWFPSEVKSFIIPIKTPAKNLACSRP